MFRQNQKPKPISILLPLLGKGLVLVLLQVTNPVSAPCLRMEVWIWLVDGLQLEPREV